MQEEMSAFATNITLQKYAWKDANGKPTETWDDIAVRVVEAVVPDTERELRGELIRLIQLRKFIPGGRYLYSAGRPYHQVNNCFLYRAVDSREGWADLSRKATLSLMSGGGIGAEYSTLREKGSPISRTGGTSSGPLSLMQMVNEIGRHVMQGGSRRSALWAGLNWDHLDIQDFIHLKDWPEWLRKIKETDFHQPAPMDMTNISVGLDWHFFHAMKSGSHTASKVYYDTCYQMFKKSEPGFAVNIDDHSECLRNACTEITSSDDSDVCNLGSINLARIKSKEELAGVVEAATRFLVYGSVYSDLPHEEVLATRDRNRRIGLGLMGIHEWLLTRGYKYDVVPELSEWLTTYAQVSDIIGETTTGIEPIFAPAFKRRYLRNSKWVYEYVVDPTAKRLIEQYGIKEEDIEDAYTLSRTLEGFRKRLVFQTEIQRYIDHGISSTINLSAWGTEGNSEDNWKERADILYDYLPNLRGITCYADGSRGGQPLSVVKYDTALKHQGQIIEEQQDICELSKTGGAC
jgi:ribonucleoside-diphosphate reductase alpha chain